MRIALCARPERARGNAHARVHEPAQCGNGRGRGKTLTTQARRRMRGEGERTPSAGAGRCCPAYSQLSALAKPPHRPRRPVWEWSQARCRRRSPPGTLRRLWVAMAGRSERAEFCSAAQRPPPSPWAPRRRPPAPRRHPPAKRRRPPLAALYHGGCPRNLIKVRRGAARPVVDEVFARQVIYHRGILASIREGIVV
jgi:hypothetical protein